MGSLGYGRDKTLGNPFVWFLQLVCDSVPCLNLITEESYVTSQDQIEETRLRDS